MNHGYLSIICEKGGFSCPKRLRFYAEQYLFRGIDFAGKSMLDIGGGKGAFSFYAAMNGASRVVVMEPEFDGSSSGMIAGFNKIHTGLGLPPNISLTTKILEDLDLSIEKFDMVLMHNSVNHVDEESCIRLPNDAAAREKYLEYFGRLRDIMVPGGRLIIADCSNSNFFGNVVGINPLARSIEWEKHQAPEVWAKLLSEQGFRTVKVSWSSPNRFGKAGRVLLGNRLVAYLMYSHFRLELIREQADDLRGT